MKIRGLYALLVAAFISPVLLGCGVAATPEEPTTTLVPSLTATATITPTPTITPTITLTPTPRPTATPPVGPVQPDVYGVEDITIQSLCIEIEQYYPQVADPAFELDLWWTVASRVRELGLRPGRAGDPCDATLHVTFNGHAIASTWRRLFDQQIITCYLAANMYATLRLEVEGRVLGTAYGEPGFGGYSLVGSTITEEECLEPTDSPYQEAAGQPVNEALARLWGVSGMLLLYYPAGLRAQGAAAVPELVELLYGDEWQLQRAAAYGLSELEAHDTASELIAALSADRSDVRQAAAYGIRGFLATPELRDALIVALGDPDAEVRRLAVETLEKYGDEPGVIPALVGALNDEDARVRLTAATVLEEIDPEEVSVELAEAAVNALRDSNPTVREAAAKLLRATGPVPGAPEALLDLMVNDPNAEVRRKAASAYSHYWSYFEDSMTSSPEIIAAMLDILEYDWYPGMRSYAASILGNMPPDPSTRAALITALEDDSDPRVRASAARALDEVEINQAVIDGLVEVLREDSDDSVRRDAAFSLGNISWPAGDQMVIPALIGALESDPEQRVRRAARIALERQTGLEFGYDDGSAWREWWESQQ